MCAVNSIRAFVTPSIQKNHPIRAGRTGKIEDSMIKIHTKHKQTPSTPRRPLIRISKDKDKDKGGET